MGSKVSIRESEERETVHSRTGTALLLGFLERHQCKTEAAKSPVSVEGGGRRLQGSRASEAMSDGMIGGEPRGECLMPHVDFARPCFERARNALERTRGRAPVRRRRACPEERGKGKRSGRTLSASNATRGAPRRAREGERERERERVRERARELGAEGSGRLEDHEAGKKTERSSSTRHRSKKSCRHSRFSNPSPALDDQGPSLALPVPLPSPAPVFSRRLSTCDTGPQS